MQGYSNMVCSNGRRNYTVISISIQRTKGCPPEENRLIDGFGTIKSGTAVAAEHYTASSWADGEPLTLVEALPAYK